MSTSDVLDVFRSMINLAIQISGPMLLVCMAIGILIAILQAVTQIHDQSLAFILKLAVVMIYLSLGGSRILASIHDFIYSLFRLMV